MQKSPADYGFHVSGGKETFIVRFNGTIHEKSIKIH